MARAVDRSFGEKIRKQSHRTKTVNIFWVRELKKTMMARSVDSFFVKEKRKVTPND